jgi:hypothetical protein
MIVNFVLAFTVEICSGLILYLETGCYISRSSIHPVRVSTTVICRHTKYEAKNPRVSKSASVIMTLEYPRVTLGYPQIFHLVFCMSTY